MENKDNSKPTTPLHGNNHHHEDVIKVSIWFGEKKILNLQRSIWEKYFSTFLLIKNSASEM